MAAAEILEMLSPGALTSVQDLGRYGYGRFGVAPSGALDAFALRIGNLLVGNRQDQACLESMLLGPRVKALTDIVAAVTGGDLQPRRNGQPIRMWQPYMFKRDDILSFRAPLSGFRAYIAVAGGIDVPVIMGSRSTNLCSGFGGYQGRQLRKGDVLRSESTGCDVNIAGRVINSDWIPQYSNKWVLRVVWGLQAESRRHRTGTQERSQIYSKAVSRGNSA